MTLFKHVHRRSDHCGQSMVEFLIVLPVLLMLILGAIQYSLVYRAKSTLQYAAFETTRAGALNNARMWAMENAFARSMAPLFTNRYVARGGSGDCRNTYRLFDAPPGTLGLQHAQCARDLVRAMMRGGQSRILLINPSRQSFGSFGRTDTAGNIVIPNDNLMWRNSTPRGSGANQQSIQDANLMKVHVAFCYRLVVPFVNRMMRAMMTIGSGPAVGSQLPSDRAAAAGIAQAGNFGPLPSGFGRSCANRNDPHIPIYAQSLMRMQSEAIADTTYPRLGDFRCAGNCGA